MGFAERLRYYREQKGINQKELSRMIGRSDGAVSNYENHVSTPKIEDIIKIINVLEIEPNLLFWDDLPDSIKKRVNTLPDSYDALSTEGKQKADEYIKDLAGNPKYTATSNLLDDISDEIQTSIGFSAKHKT